MRLIDADTLQGKEVRGTIGDISGDFIPAFEIALAPTIEAKPVKYGRWEHKEFQIAPFGVTQALVCSNCGYDHEYDEWFAICPNCGAKMDLEANE